MLHTLAQGAGMLLLVVDIVVRNTSVRARLEDALFCLDRSVWWSHRSRMLDSAAKSFEWCTVWDSSVASWSGCGVDFWRFWEKGLKIAEAYPSGLLCFVVACTSVPSVHVL